MRHPSVKRRAPLAPLRVRPQIKRTKEVLSANSDVMLSVEELLPEKDFRTTINRDKLEELAGGWASRGGGGGGGEGGGGGGGGRLVVREQARGPGREARLHTPPCLACTAQATFGSV